MTKIGAPTQAPINIGDEAAPPFAVPPRPSNLFKRRAERLRALAAVHEIGGYLAMVADICALQHEIAVGNLALPTLPDGTTMEAARNGAMPPLAAMVPVGDAAFRATLDAMAAGISNADDAWPEPAREAAIVMRELDEASLAQALDNIAADTVPPGEIAAHALIAAAAEVYYARAAALLDASVLQPVADGVCPACGAGPIASDVVGRPNAQSTRFCTCSRCATEWNVVRVKCVRCGSTGGIRYLALEGRPDTIKGETCDRCHGYVKIFSSIKDSSIEPMADDVASLGLDLKLIGAGWKRLGRNSFLMGYSSAAPEGEPSTQGLRASGPDETGEAP